jgi:glycerol kinase
MGAAYFAGPATGFFKSIDELRKLWQKEATYESRMQEESRKRLYSAWQSAVKHSAGWARENS